MIPAEHARVFGQIIHIIKPNKDNTHIIFAIDSIKAFLTGNARNSSIIKDSYDLEKTAGSSLAARGLLRALVDSIDERDSETVLTMLLNSVYLAGIEIADSKKKEG